MYTVPKYAENIIVLVQNKYKYYWYVSDKDYWYLNLRKLIKFYEDKGYKIPNSDDFSDRFDIDIVDKSNADRFLMNMEKFLVKGKVLSAMLRERDYNYVGELVPSLFIDFDNEKLCSFFPEPASFHECIPEGWYGSYVDFMDIVPRDLRYWIIDNVNYFREGRDNE